MLEKVLIAAAILSVTAQYEGENRYGVGRSGRVEAGIGGGDFGEGLGSVSRDGYGHRHGHNHGYNGQNGQPGYNSRDWDRREGSDPRGYDRTSDPRGYDRNDDGRGYGRAEGRFSVGASSGRYRRSPQGLGGGLSQSDGLGNGGLSRSEGLGGSGLSRSEGLGGGLGKSEGLGGGGLSRSEGLGGDGLSRSEGIGGGLSKDTDGFGGGLNRGKRRALRPMLKRRHCNSFYGKNICYQIYPGEADNLPGQLSCWRMLNGDHNCTEVENLLYLDKIDVTVNPEEMDGIPLQKSTDHEEINYF